MRMWQEEPSVVMEGARERVIGGSAPLITLVLGGAEQAPPGACCLRASEARQLAGAPAGGRRGLGGAPVSAATAISVPSAGALTLSGCPTRPSRSPRSTGIVPPSARSSLSPVSTPRDAHTQP